MQKKLIVWSGLVLGLAPVVALAQFSGGTATGGGVRCGAGAVGGITGASTIGLIVCKIGDILNLVVPVLIVLAVIYFVWGVVSYVIGTDEETKKSAREKMIYGIIGLTVIVGVWGLVNILISTFGISGAAQNINLPTTPY